MEVEPLVQAVDLTERVQLLEAYVDYLYTKLVELEQYCGLFTTNNGLETIRKEETEIMKKPKLQRTQEIKFKDFI